MNQPFSSVQENADFDTDSLEKLPSQSRDIDEDSLDKEYDGNIEEDSLNETQEKDTLHKSVKAVSLNRSSGKKEQVFKNDSIVDKNSRNTLKKDDEFPQQPSEILIDENYCYDKLDRFFSAFDFCESSRNIVRDIAQNSSKKLVVPKKKIPLQSFTISKSERKKCSYLEQYKKKCSKKLKKVMKDCEVKDSKDGTNTSPASDLCSISSKPSAISLRSDGKEESAGMVDLEQSEEQFFYDAIQKYEHTNISKLNFENQSDSNLDNKSSLDFKPGSGEEIKQPSCCSNTSYDFRKLKSIIEEKIEKNKISEDSIEMIYMKSEKHSRASIGVQNMASLTQRILSNHNVQTITSQQANPIASKRSLPIQQPKCLPIHQQRSMPNQQRRLIPNQKSPLKAIPSQKPIPLKRTMVSNLKLQSDKYLPKSPTKRNFPEQVSKVHKTESGIHKQEWTNSTLIVRSPKRAVKLSVHKKLRSPIVVQVKKSKTKTKNVDEIQEKIVEPKCAEVINSTSERRDQVCELSSKKKAGNTQSEFGFRALRNKEHIKKEMQRPATTNNTSQYYGTSNHNHNYKSVQRKKYVDIYQAKQNIRRNPMPLVQPSLAKLPAKKKALETMEVVKTNIKEKEDVNKDRRTKTPHPKQDSAKGGDRNKTSKPLKRYFLKKKPPPTEEEETLLPDDEDKEDQQLKLLEEKKEQLEKQLKTMNSKSRSTNFVMQT